MVWGLGLIAGDFGFRISLKLPLGVTPGPSTLFGAGVSRGKVWTPGGGTKGSCPMSTPFPPLPCARVTVPSSFLA